MDLYNISFLLLFLANFETVTRILRTETNVMLCVSFTASNHWLLRKHVCLTHYTIWLIISTSQIILVLEGSVLKHSRIEHEVGREKERSVLWTSSVKKRNTTTGLTKADSAQLQTGQE